MFSQEIQPALQTKVYKENERTWAISISSLCSTSKCAKYNIT